MIPVLFANPGSDVVRGAWWDQTIVEHMLANSRHDLAIYTDPADLPTADGLVLVVHAENGTPDIEHHVAELNATLRRYRWVLALVTSDETDRWPWWSLESGDRLRVWRQHPTVHEPDRILPLGPPPHAIDMQPSTLFDRSRLWSFAGQITHERRRRMAEAVAIILDVPHQFVPTEAFLSGMSIGDYMGMMRDTAIALCPSGPHTPDTFRLYEALESGCVPVADVGPLTATPTRQLLAYWSEAFYTPPPFPIVNDWSEMSVLPGYLFENSHDLFERQAICSTWWQLEKRNLAHRFDADIDELAGLAPAHGITAIVTTSPITSHPNTAITDETVDSILERIPGDVIVAADGVRPEQADMAPAYSEYLERLHMRSRRDPSWRGRVFIDYDGVWRHQAGTTARALAHVWTTHMLFAEHDTPLINDLPLDRIMPALDMFDVVRLHHEAAIHPEHEHLNVGELVTVGGVGFQPTVQWSQRPHLASVATYRRILELFPDTARTMIEDKLHSVAQVRGWSWLRTAIYHPDGDIKRSTHTDGRAGAPKYDMRFE